MLCIQEFDYFGYTQLLVSLRLSSISAVYPRVKTFWRYTNASYIFIFITGLFMCVYIYIYIYIYVYVYMLDGFNFKIYTEANGMQLENWCSTKS